MRDEHKRRAANVVDEDEEAKDVEVAGRAFAKRREEGDWS